MVPLSLALRARLNAFCILGFITFALALTTGCSGVSSDAKSPINTSPLQFTSTNLPSGAVGVAYSAILQATGGASPYSFKVVSGTLPPGLLAGGSGAISGTPTSAGQFSFTAQVTDSSATPLTAQQTLSIKVNPQAGVVVTTSSLPNGTIGAAYSSNLAASGGNMPYSWGISSGSLPGGLSLGSSGTISGTPTTSGQSNFTVKVTDSSLPQQTASKPLSIPVSTTGNPLNITGSIAPKAWVGQAYSSTDTAAGGTPAYAWSLASGQLPPGLTLGGTTGTISGTPNQVGAYNFTLKVDDSGSPPQHATQAAQITVNKPQPVWSLQTTPVGWQFLSPTGLISCKYNALSKVDDTDLSVAGTQAAVLAKYGGSWDTWAQQQSARLSSLGFTAAGYYSFRYQSHWSSGMLPAAPSYAVSQDLLADNYSYHVKDIFWIPQPNGMKCGSAIYQGVEADPFDPIAQAGFDGGMANFQKEYGGVFGHAIIAILDEADFLFGLDRSNDPLNSHADLGLVVASNTPMMKHSRPGGGGDYKGGNYNFPDETVYAKLALRDYLKGLYSDSISALNTAWGTSYTTFDTSDVNGMAGIANGTYASWGGNAACTANGAPYACCTGNGTGSCVAGTGLLDENGSHIISNSQACRGRTGNGPQENENWSTVAQIETDLHGFVGELAAAYSSKLRTGWLAACEPNCPPEAIPIYDGPNYVYSSMAPNTDLFWIAPGTFPSADAEASTVQTIINNTGGKPVIVANYFIANPDSWTNHGCPGQQGQDCQGTQAARGALFAALDQAVLPLKNPDGKYAVVGLEHWSLYDKDNDYGLFTPNDNGYDGSAASTATSSGACATSHSYNAPAICQDSNGNYEGIAVASCTSGGSAPIWNTNYNGLTTNDGSCTWFNEGPYTPTPESNNWGNTLLPIADFLTSGICDP